MMKSLNLTEQIEASILQLMGKYFSNYRPIIQTPESKVCVLSIQLEYLVWGKETAQTLCQNEDFMNNLDIGVGVGGDINIGGCWRHKFLTFSYSPKHEYWFDDDDEQVPTPYPEGREIEQIARELHQLLSPYLLVSS